MFFIFEETKTSENCFFLLSNPKRYVIHQKYMAQTNENGNELSQYSCKFIFTATAVRSKKN